LNSTDPAQTAERAPTIIEIYLQVETTNDDRESPYYLRTELVAWVSSTTKFDRISILHMGFKSWTKGKRWIYLRDGRYVAGAPLEPNGGAQVDIPPFKLTLENVGDGFLKVNVRLPNGMERCRMVILQEGELPRKPIEIDEYIKVEDIWYMTATINGLQKLRIEEIGEEEEEADD